MAAAERRRELRAARPQLATLSIEQQRQLARLVDELYADADELALARAVTRWAFEQRLMLLPHTEALQREGVVLVPVTPWGDVEPVWIVDTAPAPPPPPPATRTPSLRELGALPISDEAA